MGGHTLCVVIWYVLFYLLVMLWVEIPFYPTAQISCQEDFSF